MLRTKGPGLVILVMAVLATLAPAPVAGSPRDRVELESGEIFYGQVLRQTRHEVSIQLAGGGILSFRRSQVKRVRADGQLSPERAPPAAAASKPERAPVVLDTRWPRPLPSGSEKSAPPVTSPSRRKPEASGDSSATDAFSGLRLDRIFASERKAPAVGRAAPENLGRRVVDKEHGFALALPRGVGDLADPEGVGRKSRSALHRFRSKGNEATVTVSVHDSAKPLNEVKRSVLEAKAREADRLLVEQDAALWSHGYAGWLVELAAQRRSEAWREYLVFVPRRREVIVFTYACRDENWSDWEGPFQSSFASLSLLDAKSEPRREGRKEDPTPAPEPAGDRAIGGHGPPVTSSPGAVAPALEPAEPRGASEEPSEGPGPERP